MVVDNKTYFNGSFSLLRPEWLKKEFGFLTGENVKIAVIDSGCDKFILNDSRVAKGISFILDKNDDYIDKLGHGTACIDLILQIAPSVKIMPIKVFGSTLETSIEILFSAINFALENNVNIVNLSLGTKLEEALHPLYSVCEKAKDNRIIIVASNANVNINSYPAIFENVISVSAAEKSDKFDFDYYEDELCECLADGFPNNALVLNGLRVKMSDNSFAAPIISGMIALLLQKFGKLSLKDVRELLKRFSANNRTLI